MAKVNQFYRLWLKPHHLPAQGVEVTIEKATVETLHPRPGQSEQKIVLAFKGKQRRLILNAGNANRLCDIAGSDNTDDWTGLVINLKPIDFTVGRKTIIVGPVTHTPPANRDQSEPGR